MKNRGHKSAWLMNAVGSMAILSLLVAWWYQLGKMALWLKRPPKTLQAHHSPIP